MDTKVTNNKTEKEVPITTSGSAKQASSSDSSRPLTKRRPRRRLPSW